MQFSSFLMCFVLLSVGPLCWAYSDADFEADKLRARQIIDTSKNGDVDISHIEELLQIYRRLSPRYSPEEKKDLDQFIAEHYDQELIDGVPAQGGKKINVLIELGKQVAIEAAKEAGPTFLSKLWDFISG